VFGISTLPPIFVTLLTEIARFVPVHYYINSPDQSTRDNARTNPMFTAFGGASRDLLNILTANGIASPTHISASTVPPPETLLGQLQHDIRVGITRGRGDTGEPAKAAASTDCSLTVHICHSPLREMEVLRDQLLDAFVQDPTLRPHDVLVLVPDVGVYAPFADAVFGDVDPELPSMPHRVADRSFERTALPARALLQLLQLVTARCTSSEVLNFLRMASVCRAAGIEASDMDRVVHFVEEARIRWGYDGATRKEQFDLPAIEDNSWRNGLDRLLVGYATGPLNALVDSVLPVAGDTLGDADLLGTFTDWVERLFATLERLRQPRSLPEWSATLQEVFREMIRAEGPDERDAFDEVIAALTALHQLALESNADRAVEFEVVRRYLESRLDVEHSHTGFLAGGMTVCAMKPMRAIPFRVIAMVGLDDAAFPRRERRAAFDLVGIDPRLGDRDTRSDDRQLFLDTILCARDRLILSYVGRSQKNNSEIAPSVVISELLDELDHAFSTGRTDAKGHRVSVRSQITVSHHLQPFSPAYFDGQDSRLFSFSATTAKSVSGARVRAEDPAFISDRDKFDAVVAPGTDGHIALRDLIDCWVNPAAFYCKRTLGLYIPRDDDAVDETESMTVGTLEKYGQQQGMLDRHLAGDDDTARALAHAQAMGDLPSGALAPEWHEVLSRELDDFLLAVGRPMFQEARTINIAGDGWTVTGRIDGCVGGGLFFARATALKPKDKMRAWISHVVLCHEMRDAGTTLMGTDGTMVFAPIARPEDVMKFLVAGYMRALHSPLPFLAQASLAYRTRARATRPGKSPAEAAEDAYTGGERSRGDVLDEYVELCWRGRVPWKDCAEQFEELALAFWDTLTDASKGSAATAGATSE
jgi:exodeoxyribonuclease V gamma subunit